MHASQRLTPHYMLAEGAKPLNVDKLIKLKKSIVETSAKITHQRLEVKDHVYVGMCPAQRYEVKFVK